VRFVTRKGGQMPRQKKSAATEAAALERIPWF
jgi:hypothetical protein